MYAHGIIIQQQSIHFQFDHDFNRSARFARSASFRTDGTSSTPQGSPAMPRCHFSAQPTPMPAGANRHTAEIPTNPRAMPSEPIRMGERPPVGARGKTGQCQVFSFVPTRLPGGFWEVVVGEGARREKIDRKSWGFTFGRNMFWRGSPQGSLHSGRKIILLYTTLLYPNASFSLAPKHVLP